MKIINVVLGTLLGLTTIGVSPSFAGTMDCSRTTTNWMWCTQDNGDFLPDVLQMTSPDGSKSTKITVLCTGDGGNRWESYGNMTKEQNRVLSNYWCENYVPNI